MLSTTQSGFTTWTLFLAFLVKCLWVLEPLRPCDVKMCVAFDGVRLYHAWIGGREARVSMIGSMDWGGRGKGTNST